MTEFSVRDALGDWSIVVSLNGLTVGHIREVGGGGGYGYYHGPNDVLICAFQDHDLGALKKTVDALVRRL